MLTMTVVLCSWMWSNEYAPTRWREGVAVNLFKKGDRGVPGNSSEMRSRQRRNASPSSPGVPRSGLKIPLRLLEGVSTLSEGV